MFAGNLLDWADAIRAEGVVKAPYDAARQSPVHELGIAAVAATALLSDGHHGKIYTLSGPEALTKAEQVTAISKAIGRDIRFEELVPEQAREQWLRDGCPEDFADWRIESLAVSVDGTGSLPPTDTFQRITGRPPRTFAQWPLDHAADFRPLARTGEAT